MGTFCVKLRDRLVGRSSRRVLVRTDYIGLLIAKHCLLILFLEPTGQLDLVRPSPDEPGLENGKSVWFSNRANVRRAAYQVITACSPIRDGPSIVPRGVHEFLLGEKIANDLDCAVPIFKSD